MDCAYERRSRDLFRREILDKAGGADGQSWIFTDFFPMLARFQGKEHVVIQRLCIG